VGFIASVVLGALAKYFLETFSAASWYLWLVSGTASAFGFFWVTFRLAPARPVVLKWALVSIVSGLGLISALGALLFGHERVQAFAGVAMLFIAITYARQTTDEIAADLNSTMPLEATSVSSEVG